MPEVRATLIVPPRGSRAGRAAVAGLFTAFPIAIVATLAVSYFAFASLPPVPQPAENPITESKRVLGKILFSEEQLSSSNTQACASCHSMTRGATDARVAVNPGPDGFFNTADDAAASPGVIRSDFQNDYVRDQVYGLGAQATGRTANSPINAAYATDLFWDGRARSQFIDPMTGEVAIASGGALESQCVNPPLSNIEMAHDAMNWGDIAVKLARVKPLDLATSLPADVAAALADHPGYPDLFERAFGDPAITSQRVAFAIGTYERTLISDQSPYDTYIGGDHTALTPAQASGLQTFMLDCASCHTAPLLSSNTFRNTGLRPPEEDLGRQNVTGNPNDRGRFKVPSVRNAGLHRSFMHNGQFTTLFDVVRFYDRFAGAAPQFTDNIDPSMNNIHFPPASEAGLIDFLTNAVTDPRVANGTFPFDLPVFYSNRTQDHPTLINAGNPGTGGFTPAIIALDPPMVGNLEYRLGLDRALPDATATLSISLLPPTDGIVNPDFFQATLTATGINPGEGLATFHLPLTPALVSGGQVLYAQWSVVDDQADGGVAYSNIARIPVFCGSSGCPSSPPPPCGTADFNNDGDTGTDADIEAFFACLAGNCCPTCQSVDFNQDGDLGTDADIESFFRVLAGGHC